MMKKEEEIVRIDGELKSLRQALGVNSAGDIAASLASDSMSGRVAKLEEKTILLGYEIAPIKRELTGAASDWKGIAFEIVAAKVSWDIISVALPSALKLNEEKLLQKLKLEYKETTRGYMQRLGRIPVDPGTPGTGAGQQNPDIPTAAEEGRLRRAYNSLRDLVRGGEEADDTVRTLASSMDGSS